MAEDTPTTVTDQLLLALGFTPGMSRVQVLERAHQDLVKLSRQFVGLALLAGELGQHTSLEQLAHETRQQVDTARAAIAEAEGQRAEVERSTAEHIERRQAEADRQLDTTQKALRQAQEELAARRAEVEAANAQLAEAKQQHLATTAAHDELLKRLGVR